MVRLDLTSKQRRNAYSILKYLFLIALILLLGSVFFFNGGGVLNGVFITVLFFSGASLGYVKQHIEIGQITFSNTEVIIEREEDVCFQLKELQKVKLVLHSYKNEESLATIFGISGGLTGLGNYVEFMTHHTTFHRYEFFIETEVQKQKLKDIHQYWQANYPT